MIKDREFKLEEAKKELNKILKRNPNAKPIFIAITGSVSYGLDIEGSDIDMKGVFLQHMDDILQNIYKEQIGSDDCVLYEIGKFLQMMKSNNPNIMELLATPPDCVVYKDPIWDYILSYKEHFLSMTCKNSFGGYATDEIHRARSLNKKIHEKMPKRRKDVLDFCYAIRGCKSVKLRKFLKEKGIDQSECGVVNIPHVENTFALYHSDSGLYRGILSKEHDNTQMRYTSIPKEDIDNVVTTFYYNKDGFSQHCKKHKQYWEWVEKRNENRYVTNLNHGQNFDGKNLMHCHRLLNMARDIAEKKEVIIRRPDEERVGLLKIRLGQVNLSEIADQAEVKIKEIDNLFDNCDLPKTPDFGKINELLLNVRKKQIKGGF